MSEHAHLMEELERKPWRRPPGWTPPGTRQSDELNAGEFVLQWWRSLGPAKMNAWLDSNASDLPWNSRRRLLMKDFASEDELMRSVKRARSSLRGSAKAVATRKRNSEEKRRRELAEAIQEACATWDAVHWDDEKLRADQALDLKQKARGQTSEAIERREISPFSRWNGKDVEGRDRFTFWCERCDQDARKTEAHHPDYSKPLEIAWLCPCCHAAIHLSEFSQTTWLRLFQSRLADTEVRDLLDGSSPRIVEASQGTEL